MIVHCDIIYSHTNSIRILVLVCENYKLYSTYTSIYMSKNPDKEGEESISSVTNLVARRRRQFLYAVFIVMLAASVLAYIFDSISVPISITII